MFAEQLDVVFASVLELEGKFPILQTQDLPMFDSC
jgi:hypothetical protein